MVGALLLASAVKNVKVGDRSREFECKQKRASLSAFLAAILVSCSFIVPGGLYFGAARSVDDVVEAGCPFDGQVRRCAMPDADSFENGRVSLPVRPAPTNPSTLVRKLRTFAALEKAWAQVRSSAFKSEADQTRAEVRKFELVATSSLRSIQSSLSAGRFKFLPARGALLTTPGKKKKRPIVIAPIESRIVQRAILDIAQEIPSLKVELHAGFNFGGVSGKGFGVPGAIAKAVRCAQAGGYFIRTDIRAFFTAVPRLDAIEAVCTHFSADASFADIFRAAAKTELIDAASFGDEVRLFPLQDEGVAQGSCLSPLLCNYLLRDFDKQMNDRGVTCIRYIDDFILFAATKRKAELAFTSGLKTLKLLGLDAYDPFNPADAAKAEHGPADQGFSFLGCEIWPDRVRPTQEKREGLLLKIEAIFSNALNSLDDAKAAIRTKDQTGTFSGAVVAASNVIRAWGNTYAFCSDDRLMSATDAELTKKFSDFRTRFSTRLARLQAVDRRRAMGLFCLADCNREEELSSARSLSISFRTVSSSSVRMKPARPAASSCDHETV